MNFGTPREVGYPPRILSARKNLRLVLTDRQVQILVGSLLGDGYIEQKGKIQLEQSEQQKAYLRWKYAELKNLGYLNPPKAVQRYDKRNGRTYRSYRFWLRQYFRPWRSIFYSGRSKIFPEELKLTPLSIAVWYMDDGCYSDHRCTIATDNFSKASIQSIQEKLLDQFQIHTFVRSNGKLGIRAKDQKRFFSLVRAHVLPSMQYKIP